MKRKPKPLTIPPPIQRAVDAARNCAIAQEYGTTPERERAERSRARAMSNLRRWWRTVHAALEHGAELRRAVCIHYPRSVRAYAKARADRLTRN